jgi:hypothetical protein
MAKVGRVELQISQVERFLVKIHYLDGRDVRSDRAGMPGWPYEKAAKDSWTVGEWRRERFNAVYPGFDVDVLDGDCNAVLGNTRLKNLRESYDG